VPKMGPESARHDWGSTRVLQTRDTNSLKRPQSKLVSPSPREELKRVKIGELAKNHDEEHDYCMAENMTTETSGTVIEVRSQNTLKYYADKSTEEILSLTEKFAKFSKSVQTSCRYCDFMSSRTERLQSPQWNMNERQLIYLVNSAFGSASWSGEWAIDSDTSKVEVGYNSYMVIAAFRVQFAEKYGGLSCDGMGFSDVYSRNTEDKSSMEVSKNKARARAIKNALWKLGRLTSVALDRIRADKLYESNVSVVSATQNPTEEISYYFHESATNWIYLLQRDVASPAKEILVRRYHMGPKTIAVLLDSLPFSPLVAKSGWGHSWFESVISGSYWTERVINLYKVVGLEPRTHKYDGSKPFGYYASHAEKQLIAYIVQQLEVSGTRVKETLRCQTLHILVSSEVCDDCKRFTNAVITHFGFAIELHHVTKKHRQESCCTNSTVTMTKNWRGIN
jgi:hypothetical protein